MNFLKYVLSWLAPSLLVRWEQHDLASEIVDDLKTLAPGHAMQYEFHDREFVLIERGDLDHILSLARMTTRNVEIIKR